MTSKKEWKKLNMLKFGVPTRTLSVPEQVLIDGVGKENVRKPLIARFITEETPTGKRIIFEIKVVEENAN